MGMGIGQNTGRSAMLTEHVKYLLNAATLLRAGIEFAVAVGTGSTLAEAVVALLVHLLRPRDVGQVLLAVVHILAALQHYGPEAQLYQPQGCKESAGTCPYDDDLRLVADIAILRMDIRIVRRLLVDVEPHLQVDEDGTLSCINRAAQDADALQGAHGDAMFLGHETLQLTAVCRHLRQHSQL